MGGRSRILFPSAASLAEDGLLLASRKLLARLLARGPAEARCLVFSWLTTRERSRFEKNLVWIMGSTRSGSTWLAGRLLRDLGTVVWDEPDLGMNLAAIRENGERSDLRSRRTYFFCDELKETFWRPALRRMILERCYLHAGTLGRRIVIKEPESYGAEIVLDCLPRSCLIFLIRDGRDVVDSCVDAHSDGSWDPTRPPLTTREARLETITKYANMWVELTRGVQLAFERHDPVRRLLVRYENLLADTETELRKICRFLDLTATGAEIARVVAEHDFRRIPAGKRGPGKKTRSAEPGGWRRNLAPEERAVLLRIVGDTLRDHGYDASE